MGIIIGAEIDLRNVYVTHGDVPLARDIHVRRRYTPTPMGIHQFHKHTGNVNRLPEIQVQDTPYGRSVLTYKKAQHTTKTSYHSTG
ncbi:hypothetical protein CEXT_49281 [Caerostris extrusa]|uniref:Uncharacterized protein n=1 Tax=Caerostris extrusa TaxID=172846 RepID=A0AAV4XNT5_CAEEX|nr:hypothetical protein CEXT_49281 [Caerostris extrusa]